MKTKKKILVVLTVLSVVFTAGWNFYSIKNNTIKLSDWTLDDIEAVAACEVSKGENIKFQCEGDDTCSKTVLGHTLTCDGTEVID